MQQIINFVIRNKTFLMFALLFSIAFALTIQSHSYHRSQFLNSTNAISGGFYGISHSINQYFNLTEENAKLAEENTKLHERLFNLKNQSVYQNRDASIIRQHFNVKTAHVYNNSYALSNNYLTINKGENDSIKQDFGVITSKGIVGIIDATSKNYSRVLSVLSKKSRINAKLKATNHIGSLQWNTKSAMFVQLNDVSKIAPVKIGDTIVTGGQSTIFPKGIDIGSVESFKTDIDGDSYVINVKLFNDMTNIGTVYILDNINKKEIKTLEGETNE